MSRRCKSSNDADVLLINPPATHPLKDYVNSQDVVAFPLGLSLLAGALVDVGFGVRALDCVALDIRPERLHAVLPEEQPALVGITVPFATVYPNALRACHCVREAYPLARIVLGGNHVTYLPERALVESRADAVALYEGDASIVDLARWATTSTPSLESIAGIALLNDARLFLTPPRAPIFPLDHIPKTHRSVFERRLYSDFAWNSIMVSRGCFGKCGFCSTAAFNGHKVRRMSFPRVIEEISQLGLPHEVASLTFADDLFTSQKAWIREFCCLKQRQALPFKWGCMSRIDTVDRALLVQMQNAGLNSLFFGVESLEPQSLRAMGKRYDFSRACDVVRQAEDIGIAVTVSFVIGLPGEGPEVEGTVSRFLETARPSTLSLGMLSLYPGTAYYENASGLGLRPLDIGWENYGHEVPVTENATFPSEMQFDVYLRLMRRFKRLLNGADIDLLSAIR